MKKYLLGIDVGTTGTKTLLFRADGQLIGHAYEAYPLLTPQVGWSEQRAEDWWQAVVHTVRQVCEDPDVAKNVAGISLSLQGGTFVPTDADGRALRPACRHDRFLLPCGYKPKKRALPHAFPSFRFILPG